MESTVWVMSVIRVASDALGVVTICLVSLLTLLGLFCILYSCYFRARIHSQGYIRLNYFSGPWIIRITFILFSIWWGFGEIIRLSLLRRRGRILDELSFQWQETICKCYIVSNLGFAEPCLFLTLVFLLRAPLEMGSRILTHKWNAKTACCIILYCVPSFTLQLFVILIGPQLNKVSISGKELPHYFTSSTRKSGTMALCAYPLLSTIIHGLFAIILTIYLFWLGRQILQLVLNKGLRKRVKILILSAFSFLMIRVLLIGLTVLSNPEHFLFETVAFSSFLCLLCCAGLCIILLVYYPVADSLGFGNQSQSNLESDCYSSRSHVEENSESSLPTRRDSSYVELSLFSSPNRD